MRFVIARHGQCENNLMRLLGADGVTKQVNPRLTELGHEQARALATALASRDGSDRPTHIYTSLMSRAVQTAAYVGGSLGLSVHGHPELAEVGASYERAPDGSRRVLKGMPREELLALCPDLCLPVTVTSDGWWHSPLESRDEQVDARAAATIEYLRTNLPHDSVVVLITHEAFIQRLVRTLLQVPSMSGWFNICNAAIIEAYDEAVPFEDTVSVDRMNETRHLSPDQLTE